MNELKLIELFGAVESLKSEFDPMYREIIGLRAENSKLRAALEGIATERLDPIRGLGYYIRFCEVFQYEAQEALKKK